MESIRKYGKPPFFVALLHGGPGAPGEMAPVARVLAWHGGVLEPLQRAASLTGQVAELSAVLRRQAALPVTLVGFSWGALLGFMVAAREPALVKKLVLIGSAPFRACDAAAIPRERMGRLSAHEQAQARLLLEVFRNARGKKARIAFARLGELCSRADAYDPIACDAEVISYQAGSSAACGRRSRHSGPAAGFWNWRGAFVVRWWPCMATTIPIRPKAYGNRWQTPWTTFVSSCCRAAGTSPGSSARRGSVFSNCCARRSGGDGRQGSCCLDSRAAHRHYP
jgi:pimeloyl-ACP methyl ester carboxylesterase